MSTKQSDIHEPSTIAIDPRRIDGFVAERVTLGDLSGIARDARYQLARVGHARFETGEFDEARRIFRGLAALDPYDAYFQSALGAIALCENDLEWAEQCLDRALRIDPTSAVARAHRCEVRLRRGALRGAAEDLGRAIEEDPKAKQPSTRRALALAAAANAQVATAGTASART